MSRMADALFNAGVISSKQLEDQKRRDEIESRKQRSYEPDSDLATLKDCASIREFRQRARDVLARRPSLLGRVIELARKYNSTKEFRRIIKIFYALRCELVHSTADPSAIVRKLLK